MSTPKTAINLYSVRALDESLTDVLDRVAAAGYDGVQFAGPYSPIAAEADPGAIADALADRDLGATPPHVGFEALRDDRERVLSAYEPFDIDGVVVPWLDPSRFESTTAVDAAAADLDDLAADLDAAELALHYHNHAHEYVPLDGELAFDRFLARTGVGVELDVGWALVGGDDPADRIHDLGDRLSQVHMKDITAGGASAPVAADSDAVEFVDIGRGDVDMRACAEAAAAVDAEWLIYEHDDPTDPTVSIDRGAAFLDAV
ncbi:sugar phosphate isomerase/epimerase family protein [Halosolutus amylolyticus]|uniref:Sugar phosphate isomerase/epimerase family protein n=1 Tax=Halosolutus amylolyticus TaxID=2932267 RepID=A0ABD5PRX4_9EURY|nr:sugar phosphate isomerase/epimerase [Halosolutus amylolyticus]